jgi:hypothetical protein
MNYLRIVGGLLLAILVGVFLIVRLAFEVIGLATAPEDFAAFQQRMPKVFQWLFTTPWLVPTVILLAATAGAAYLIWSGTRKTVQEAVVTGGVDEKRVEEMIQSAFNEFGAALKDAFRPPEPTPETITLTSHKGKPLVKLPEPELKLVSSALLGIRDYLRNDFAEFLRPLQELRNAEKIIQRQGGAAFHAQVEAPRPTMRAFIDEYAAHMMPYEDETLPLQLNLMAIKTKALPLWDALKHVSDVSQMLPDGPANGEALKLPLSQYSAVLGELENEVERVQNDIRRWRLKISRGELG